MDFTFFNPRSQKEQDFLANFVARQTTLAFFLQQLRLTAPHQAARHILVVAPRGFGKTSLLRRVSISVRTDTEFNATFIALTFREEQHNVISLDVFWRNCLEALVEAREDEGASGSEIARLNALCQQHNVRSTLKREEQDGEPAWLALQAECLQLGRRPVLLMDNLDTLLDGLMDAHQWGLRRVLQREDGPFLLAAASRYPDSTHNPQAAFFDFFRIQTLDRLNDAEVMHCLRTLAQHRGERGKKVQQLISTEPGRISALNTLSGGNPRTLAVLYSVLEAHMSDDILSQLSSMLDTFTPWYQDRTAELPVQTGAVFDALALHWDPITAAQLSAATGLDTPTVSSHLARLEKLGFIEVVSLTSKAKGRNAYQVSERFYNIWYLMRHGPRRTQRAVKFLTAFLQSCFNKTELRDLANRVLQTPNRQPEYVIALASSLRPSRLRSQLLEHVQSQSRAVDDSLAYAEVVKTLGAGARGKVKPPVDNSTTKVVTFIELFNKAIALDEAGQYTDAETGYRQAIALAPEDSKPYNNLGSLLQYRFGRYGEAEVAYRRAIAIDPNEAPPYLNLGNLLQDHLGRYDEAEAAYRCCIALNPEDAAPRNNLGTLLQHHLGRLDEAEAAYWKAIKLNPKFAAPNNNLGTLLQHYLGRYEEAETSYRNAIALDPKFFASHLNLGLLLHHHLGRYEEAESAYRQAITLNSNDARPYDALGDLLHGHFNRYEEAEASYRKAIALNPKAIWPHNGLGNLMLDKLGKPQSALESFQNGLLIQPNNATIQANCAYALALHCLDLQAASTYATQALAAEPSLTAAGRILLQGLPLTLETASVQCQRICQQIDQSLASGDPNLWTGYVDDLQRLLWYVIAQGEGSAMRRFMDEAGYAERFAPLFHAFVAALEGPDYLLKINPETRQPAQLIYDGLARQLKLYPKPPGQN